MSRKNLKEELIEFLHKIRARNMSYDQAMNIVDTIPLPALEALKAAYQVYYCIYDQSGDAAAIAYRAKHKELFVFQQNLDGSFGHEVYCRYAAIKIMVAETGFCEQWCRAYLFAYGKCKDQYKI